MPAPASTVASRWACSGRREGDGRGRHPGSFGTRDLGLLRTGRDATARSQNRATCSRKCLLLTHSATLFTIFEADVTASGLRATRQLVTGLIGRELRREELPAGTFGGRQAYVR